MNNLYYALLLSTVMIQTPCLRLVSRKLMKYEISSKMASSDMAQFRDIFKKSKKIVVLTGMI